MCKNPELQSKLIEQLDESIQSWFDDMTEMHTENLIEGLETDNEYAVAIDVMESCSHFMTRVFHKLATGVDLEQG